MYNIAILCTSINDTENVQYDSHVKNSKFIANAFFILRLWRTVNDVFSQHSIKKTWKTNPLEDFYACAFSCYGRLRERSDRQHHNN